MDGLKLGIESETSREPVPCASPPGPTQRKSLNGRTAGWTHERLEKLRALVSENLSAKEIAEMLGGVTRNAVIGKCLRDGIRLFGSMDAKRGAERARYGSKVNRPRKAKNSDRGLTQRIGRNADVIEVAEPEMPSPDHLGITFFDLAPHHCRFIKDDTYCGQGAQEDSSYCCFHHRLCYERPTRPDRKRAA